MTGLYYQVHMEILPWFYALLLQAHLFNAHQNSHHADRENVYSN